VHPRALTSRFSARVLSSGLVRRWYIGHAAALGAVTLVSLFIGFVLGQVNLANVSMLYLLAVMATAVGFGRGPAVFASVLAFLVFDWFFVEPLHQLTVADPEEWVSLVFFLLTAIVTGQLAAGQRQRAQEAQQREREAVVLYDVLRLMSEAEFEVALAAVAERLRAELHVAAVAVELWRPSGVPFRVGAGDPAALDLARAGTGSAAHVLQSGPVAVGGGQHAASGRWVRIVPPTRPARASTNGQAENVHLVPVRVGDRRIGAVMLVHPAEHFDSADDRLVSAAATQIGLAAERDRLNKEATEAEILRRTDQLRAALLNAVSHDLRTPLATIMASAGSLRQQDVLWTEEDRQGFAAAIEEEAERLNRLVGNLLDLSRIEGGSLRPQKSWHDLGLLVDDVIRRLDPVTAHHRVTVSVPDDLPPVLLDSVEIGEVLYNLVENATKYSPQDTEISVEVWREGQSIRLSVDDHGPGIPPAALPHLFDPFYRVMDGKPRPHGLGLGLAIVKGLVEAHEGQVLAQNRAGGGARFVITLPIGGAPVGLADGVVESVS
jgi:two-component system, OmpR family, sensor histidine kinase KdpD